MNGPIRIAEVLCLAVIIFSPLVDGGTTYLPVTIIRLLILSLLFCWALDGLKKGIFRIKATGLDAPVATFVFIVSVSTLFISPYKYISTQWLINFACYILLLYFSPLILDTDKKIERLVCAMAFVGLLETLVGVSQFVWAGAERVKGTFFNPNYLAGYLAAIFGVTAAMVLYEEKKLHRLFWGATAAGLVVTVFLTRSRGGLLSLLAALAFVLLYRYRKKGLLVIAGLLVLLLVVPNPVAQRVKELPETDIYAYSRVEIWKSTVSIIADHPLGTGLGIYKYISPRYSFPIEEAVAHYGKRADSAHNTYLHIGAELGLAGLALILWGLFRLARLIRQSLHATSTCKQRNGMVVGLAGGIVGILAHGMVDNNMHDPAIIILLVTMIGAMLASTREASGSDEMRWVAPFKARSFHYALLCVLMILSSLFIIKPAVAYYFHAYGEEAGRAQDGSKAARAYEWAVTLDPGNTQYSEALAGLYYRGFSETGSPKLAEMALSELGYAEKRNPVNYRFPRYRGMLYKLQAEKEKNDDKRRELLNDAAKSYAQALALEPFSASLHHERGDIMALNGKRKEASESYKRAVEIEPNYLPARLALARALARDGFSDSAMKEYQEILRIRERYRNTRPMAAVAMRYLNVDEGIVKKELKDLQASTGSKGIDTAGGGRW